MPARTRRAVAALVSTTALHGVHAQEAPQAPNPDAAAAQAWQETSGTGAVPQAVPQPDGSTRLEWRSTAGLDGYRTEVTAPVADPPALLTGLRPGDFGKVMVTSDARWIRPGDQVSFVQVNFAATGDRAVLQRYPQQVMTLQAGHTTPGLQVQGGDVPLNLSPLSAMLAMRGVSLTQSLGALTLSGFGGVVSESWESLANRTPQDGNAARMRYLRSVWGAKGEYRISPTLRAYATAQAFGDQESSVDRPVPIAPADTRSASAGFAYEDGPFLLTGEYAGSQFQEKGHDTRPGNAAVIDAAWRGPNWQVRGGYHDVGPSFVSLSQAVPPGVRETYVAGDWTTAPWLTLGTDARAGETRIAATAFTPEMTLHLKSATGRATMNLGPDLPGWNLMVSDTESRGKDPQGNPNRNSAANATLAYGGSAWNANLTAMRTEMRLAATPTADSVTTGGMLAVGRNFMFEVASISLQLGAGEQRQKLLATGAVAPQRTYQAAAMGQYANLGQLALSWQRASITPPTGGPDFVTDTYTAEVTRPITAQYAVKLFLRETRRNQAMPAMAVVERSAGLGFNLQW